MTIHKRVPFDEIERLYARAFVFVSTSVGHKEGFPNAFLQAGKYGVPILSLEADPDGIIEKHHCGVVSHGDFDGLVAGLRAIQADQRGPQRYSRNMWEYVRSHHDPDCAVQRIDDAIGDLLVRA